MIDILPAFSPQSTYRSWSVVVFFSTLVLGLNGFQIFFFPYLDLAEGLGYDGAWYFHPANQFLPSTDNYHLFRLIPATLVYFLKLVIFKNHDYHSTVRAFQIMNLIWILGSLILARQISILMGFGKLRHWLFFSLLFLNFHVFKDSYFNPVMTDTFVFFLSILLVYNILAKNQIGTLLTFFLFLFTFPIGGFVLQVIFLFQQSKAKEKDFLLPPKFGKLLAMTTGALFFIGTGAIVYVLGRKTVLTFPDDIHPYLFPLSLSSVSLFLFWIIDRHFNLFQFGFLFFRRKIGYSGLAFLFMVLCLLIYLGLPMVNNRPAKGFTGNFSISPPIYLTLKPFIGYFDNIMYLGPSVLIFLLFQIKILKARQFQFSYLIFSFFLNLFFLKPEARHTLFLFPIMVVILTHYVKEDSLKTSTIVIFSTVCLLFSKCWYPTWLASFPKGYEIFTAKVNHAIFQEFPIQHYFMFIGPFISHENYFLWLLVILGLSWYCYRFGKKHLEISA